LCVNELVVRSGGTAYELVIVRFSNVDFIFDKEFSHRLSEGGGDSVDDIESGIGTAGFDSADPGSRDIGSLRKLFLGNIRVGSSRYDIEAKQLPR